MPHDTQAEQRKRLSGTARLDLVILCAVVALGAALLAGFSWSRPTTASSTVSYHQSGSLSYSAPTTPTSIYGASGVQTGQPVYTQLVRTLSLTYTYQFRSSVAGDIKGTEQLMATLSKGAAFTRTVPLQAPTLFKGQKFTVSATLHLATLQAMVAAFNKFTVDNANMYSLSITPHVTATGRLGSAAVKAQFDQSAKFDFDQTTLTPKTSTPSGSRSSVTTAGRVGQPIISSITRSVRVPSTHQAAIFSSLTVFDVRLISLAVLAIALAAGALLGWPLIQEARSDDERVRIAMRVSSDLVEVTSLPRSSVTVIELQTFDGLEQVSRRLECPLLHLRSEAGDEYAVVDNGTVYLYRIVDQPAQRLGQVVQASSNSPRHAVVGHGSSATS